MLSAIRANGASEHCHSMSMQRMTAPWGEAKNLVKVALASPLGRGPIIGADDVPDGLQRQRTRLCLHRAGGDGRIDRAEILAD